MPAFGAVLSAVQEGCFHCGLPIPAGADWSVTIDHVARPMCCPGCESVAQAIVANGLDDYYRTRTGFADTADREALVPEQLRLYDASTDEAPDDAETIEASFTLEGIRCAACVWLIERRLAAVPGLLQADVNVATERLHVRWAVGACQASDILQALQSIGYRAYPYDAKRHEEYLRTAEKTLFRRLFIAGLAMMQVMMYAFPAYTATDGTLDADMDALMRWASLLMTIPAVLYSALPFYQGAWANLRQKALGMDVPIALGIVAAFAGSLDATWRNTGDVYYDSVTMFIFLLLCSRYVELLARRKAASALQKMQHALPASALLLKNYPADRASELVPAGLLKQGDVILVRPGDAIAADGTLIEGQTSIDLSLLTGESQPVGKTVGDAVPGGAVNAAQPMLLRVDKPVKESTMAALLSLIEQAGQGKPQLALWADKVSAWFVAGLLLLAAGVFVAWQIIDPSRAWPIAIAVLVVSCPCALSLATPTALAAATDRLLRHGVLITHGHVLETLHRVSHVVFDKTGTLTYGKPVVQKMQLLGSASREDCSRIASALESANAHPLAQAILRYGSNDTNSLQCEQVEYVAGQGVAGRIGNADYRIGNAQFVSGMAGALPESSEQSGMTSVYLGTQGNWLARFDISDEIRPDAQQVIRTFTRLGKKVILLSGDRQSAADRVGRLLGIDTVYGDKLPQQKLDVVRQLQEQKQGAIVAMVGDGINDAAVLRAADVSFAMASGAALAQTHADAVVTSEHLSTIADTALVAARTMAVVRQNLGWASLYNVIAIPAAAVGWLNPWVSAIGMSVSSAIVVLNALRLRHIKLQAASMTSLPKQVRPAPV
ncbi:heavy metal translocating P-type ATPase [Paucimonas lemoignei]|nr:heavy metal translocating P-type ATPase [Paucimonas lemoignei]